MSEQKVFYSCFDPFLKTPQPIQLMVMREKGKKAGGGVSFYGTEEFRTAKVQSYIVPKLKRTPGLQGVIFFSLDQFCYGERANIKVMQEILDLGLETHFAREDLSLYTRQDLEKWLSFILVADYSKRRDKSAFWKRLLNETEHTLPY